MKTPFQSITSYCTEESPEIPCGECRTKNLLVATVVDNTIYCGTCFNNKYPGVEMCKHAGCEIWSYSLVEHLCPKHYAKRKAEMDKPIDSNPTEDIRIVE